MDQEIIARLLKAPELGPRLTILSGGTAFNDTARVLKHLTHHSTHLLTPFDSGGSSAILRTSFDMPAVGDLRSRIMALADESLAGHQAVVKLFATRIPSDAPSRVIEILLHGLKNGSDKLITQIHEPLQSSIHRLLSRFFDAVPTNFDYRGASLGNLALTGAYLDHHRRLDPTAGLFSRLIKSQGIARVSVDANLHLGALLEDGQLILGQHRLTGKAMHPIHSPIKELFLNRGLEHESRTTVAAKRKTRSMLVDTDLIVFSQGSFYSSLLANLLPVGIGTSIAQSSANKVWIPNLGHDPEQLGLDVSASLQTLIATLLRDAQGSEPREVLTHVVFNPKAVYSGGIPHELMARWGIEPVYVSETKAGGFCPTALSQTLCRLALDPQSFSHPSA